MPNPAPTHVYLHLDAGNDRNGNPRRMFLVFETATGSPVAAVDEGYSGDTVSRLFPGAIKLGDRIPTTPNTHRDWLRHFSA